LWRRIFAPRPPHVFEDEIRERETESGEEVGDGVYPVRVDGVHDVVDARGADPSFVVATSRRYIANGYL
jgi:hypothetical protein